ncbi:hypothetical protein BGZ50_004061 [Haplosporangium sp. Z 11]|nr:hypothetical protein BGZ50_004061 [Haplosporangium sp. Z 11]
MIMTSTINTLYRKEPQLVMIEGYGILQGEMDESRLLSKYLNIPFATVQNRFQHAVAPKPWNGIRDATVHGPMCPQNVQESNSLMTMMLGMPGPGFTYSERDCLNLNVFAPRCIEQVPVICYIHGGLSQGGIALPKNDATNIVKRSVANGLPVIVVTINYRLLPSAGLLEDPEKRVIDENERVNWGLYDQKIALEWVRKYIHNFGGNPNEITLMGHSNGESSAGFHMLTSKNGNGLFKRAIMHSGPMTGARTTGNNVPKTHHRQDMTLLVQQLSSGIALDNHQLETTTNWSDALAKDSEKDKADEDFSFTFMSDACLPYMGEREKQAGYRVIDRWVDFAWGQE